MKNLFLLFLFIIIVNCSNTKKVYWCGDHRCISKKEKEAYFKKNMTVEVRVINKKEEKKYEIEKLTQQNMQKIKINKKR
jgi:hypothetical protein